MLLLLAAVACGPGRAPTTTPLKPVEVREYQGEKLGSVTDFRENSIKGPPTVDSVSYRLNIFGQVRQPRALGYRAAIDEHRHYSRVVTIYCVEGWQVKILWEGLRVMDLLEPAGIDSSARTVIFHAADGYTTSLPLDFIREHNLLLAYKMNDAPLRPERGFPFMLVAEDKWGYKWARWVTGIELSDDAGYKGYWERRGYANDGDLKQRFYED